MQFDYQALLARLRSTIGNAPIVSKERRLELPEPEVIAIGNKTILRNFMDYPRLLRREPNKLLMFLAKEMATAASIEGERAIFIGKKDAQSFKTLLNRYLKEQVLCPVCGNPDTRVEKVKRLQFLVCEACGARSSLR